LISKTNKNIKRTFDVLLAIFLIPLAIVPLILFLVLETIDTKQYSIFSQKKDGKNAKW